MRLGVPLSVAVVTALAVGCTALPIPRPFEPRAAREFFPLHPGTLWVYEVRDADGRSAIERVLVRGPYRLKSFAIDATVVEESGGMTGEFDLDVSWHPVVYYRRGVFLYKFSAVNLVGGEVSEVPLGEGEEKVLPDDPVEQPEWQSDFEIFRGGAQTDYSARMISIAQPSREAVRVRAGTFRGCLRVESRSVLDSRGPVGPPRRLSLRYTDWYAPGVGLVKSEVHAVELPTPITTFELLSFRDGRHGD
jgi:hypothetical protein